MSIPKAAVEVPRWEGYALLDVGDGEKLERFGHMVVTRPETKAWWPRAGDAQLWKQSAARLDTRERWRGAAGGLSREWDVAYEGVRCQLRLGDDSRHVGVFPEQEPHWRWIRTRVRAAARAPRVLNLFGYTGMASLVAAAAGADVTHVDASKPTLAWARHNQQRSGLSKAPIRWLLDDAAKFTARELRRGRRYDLILLDPPSFGRGPKGELWKVQERLPELLGQLARLLSEQPLGMVLTLYNLEASSLSLHNLCRGCLPHGAIDIGELALPSVAGPVLPLSLFARWHHD